MTHRFRWICCLAVLGLALVVQAQEYSWGAACRKPDSLQPYYNGVTAYLPLNYLVYLGYSTRYNAARQEITATTGMGMVIVARIGNRAVTVDGKARALPTAPVLIPVTPHGAAQPFLYPYVPLRAYAGFAGWRTEFTLSMSKDITPVAVGNFRVYRTPRHAAPALTWGQVIAQKLTSKSSQQDHRVRVEPIYYIDASRKRDFVPTKTYVAILMFKTLDVSSKALHTGQHGWFAQTANGAVYGRESMAQSLPGRSFLLKPGEAAGEHEMAIFVLKSNEPIRRIIYHDGISNFRWEIKP